MKIKKAINLGALVLGLGACSLNCGTNYVPPVNPNYSLDEKRIIESIQNSRNDENNLERFGRQIYDLKEKIRNGINIGNFGVDIETLKDENNDNDIYFVIYYKF